MAVQTAPQYQLSFACTLAQYNTMCTVTLPALGSVIRAPQQFQGTFIHNTPVIGHCDFSYEGKRWLKFYDSNMTSTMIPALTAGLAATLGAPVPENLANNPSYWGDV